MKTKRIKTALILGCVLLLSSCAKEEKLGRYVYADYCHTVHVDRDCKALPRMPNSKQKDGFDVVGVTFIDTCDFTGEYLYPENSLYAEIQRYDYCPMCVDDETFNQLSVITERNKEKEKL